LLKKIFKLYISLIIFTGLGQIFLPLGVIWNILCYFNLVLTITLVYFHYRNKIGNYLKICTVILSSLFILELVNFIVLEESLSKPSGELEVKIMSYNLFFKNKRPKATLEVIRSSNPDVLFVQELTPKWKSMLDKELGNIYPYKKIKALKGTHGIGIYSKYKLNGLQTLNNSSNKPYALVSQVSIQQRKIQLINTHLASPAVAVENKNQFFPLYYKNYKLRQEQLAKIGAFTEENESKYNCQLLVGDLNTTKYEPLYKTLKWKWVDSFVKSGKGFGFNFPNTVKTIPFLTLDYILLRGKAKCVNSYISKGGNSDHLAINSVVQI